MDGKILRAMGAWIGVIGFGVLVCSTAEAGTVGTAKVTGKVKNPSGAAISGARVRVDVVASVGDPNPPYGSGDPDPIGAHGPTTIVSTDSSGNYEASLAIPDGYMGKLYARVTVAKPPQASGNIFGTKTQYVKLDPLPAPGGTGAYALNVALSVVPYGAYVQGTVRDQETGEPLQDIQVSLSGGSRVYTDANGYYFGVFQLWAANVSGTISYIDRGFIDDQGYIGHQSVTLATRSSRTVNVNLENVGTPIGTGVVGRVLDAKTKKPVYKALVVISGLHSSGGSLGSVAMTDRYGRFQYGIGTPLSSVISLTASTAGAFRKEMFIQPWDTQTTAPYVPQSVNLKTKLIEGQIVQHDFVLEPR